MPRRTFFSFHYVPDVWRAWNVRNSWIVRQDDQQPRGFFDASVFEATKKVGDENLKRFLREGLSNTSVTCVLAGSSTWDRRWVRYEIAQSVLKRNGLLTVFIHGVENNRKELSTLGADPLAQMALYRTDRGLLFAEWKDGQWVAYKDYQSTVDERELWFPAPTSNTVVQLSNYSMSYDYAAQDGRKNIGNWIETAAGMAGR